MDDLIFYKRKLPHFYLPERTYFITFRLKYSLPRNLTCENSNSEPEIVLKDNLAVIVADSIKFLDRKDYSLLCYCIMPNHVHIVFTLLKNSRVLSKIMQSIKRYTACEINKILDRNGSVWTPESFDHIIRNDNELCEILQYIIYKPVKSMLVDDWREWKYTYLAEETVPLIIQ